MPPRAAAVVGVARCLLLTLLVGACLVAVPATPVPGEPVVIDGVTSIGWSSARYSHYIAALHAVLETFGSPVRYEELMVASGEAFATAWAPRNYSYNARTAIPGDPVVAAAMAAGARATRHSFNTPEEAWAAVCRSIDQGCPVIASNDSAANLICGYDPDGRRIYLNRYDTADTQYQLLPFEVHAGPTGAPNEIITVEVGPDIPQAEFDWTEILARAVRFADWPPDQLVHKYFVVGLPAYDAWAQTLRAVVKKDGSRKTQTMAQWLASARSAASMVLAELATADEGFADAAHHYAAEAEILGQMRGVLAQGRIDSWAESFEAMELYFPDPDVREQAAQLIEAAKEEEVLAVEALRAVLADLAPGGEPVVTAPPERAEVGDARSAEAEAHYRTGLRLKRERKWREAAAELRAAIEAEPNHADAHWTLAWVLIELKDTEGARAELRKVIELAPGSEKATQAERALDRLQR